MRLTYTKIITTCIIILLTLVYLFQGRKTLVSFSKLVINYGCWNLLDNHWGWMDLWNQWFREDPKQYYLLTWESKTEHSTLCILSKNNTLIDLNLIKLVSSLRSNTIVNKFSWTWAYRKYLWYRTVTEPHRFLQGILSHSKFFRTNIF